MITNFESIRMFVVVAFDMVYFGVTVRDIHMRKTRQTHVRSLKLGVLDGLSNALLSAR